MKNLNTTIVFASIFVATGFLALLTLYSPITTNAISTHEIEIIKNAQKIIENDKENAKYYEKLNTGNKYTIQKSCENSFLSKNKGGSLPQDVLSDLNRYLSQNSVAIGDEPLTNVKNVHGLCVLIKLVESESTEGRIANEEQIRNILNLALKEKNNLPVINGIIDNLLNRGLIEPSDD